MTNPPDDRHQAQKKLPKKRHRDPKWMAEIGAMGGSAPHKEPRTFAKNPALASRAGKIGGKLGKNPYGRKGKPRGQNTSG